MKTKTIFFISLLLVGISQGPTLAHLLELPHKIHFSATDYLVVQQIYRGWFLLGIVEIIALFSTGMLCIRLKKKSGVFIFSLMAFVCLVVIQFIFWFFTYPVNRQTDNWTVMPGNWMQLRNQWEYSHAAAALFNLLALALLIIAVLRNREIN